MDDDAGSRSPDAATWVYDTAGGQACSAVCSSYGGCASGTWPTLSESEFATVTNVTCAQYESGSSSLNPMIESGNHCYSHGDSQCSGSPGSSSHRVCRCASGSQHPSTVRWLQGTMGDSCDTTCAAAGSTCVAGTPAVHSGDIQAIASELGVTCQTKSDSSPENPCLYGSSAPVHGGSSSSCYAQTSSQTTISCSGRDSSAQRFCPCAPFEHQWVEGAPGESCDSACSAHGGCAANTPAVHTSADVIAKAHAAGATCSDASQTSSGQSFAPYISASTAIPHCTSCMFMSEILMNTTIYR